MFILKDSFNLQKNTTLIISKHQCPRLLGFVFPLFFFLQMLNVTHTSTQLLDLIIPILEEMVIPTDKEIRHIKDQNVDTQGYSEYEVFQR